MQFIDSHCHLDRIDLSEFNHDFSKLISNATASNVSHILCVSISLDKWQAMADLVAPFENIFLSVGVHPSEIKASLPSYAEIFNYAQDSRVIAIGETGLDYHYGLDAKINQQAAFIMQIEAAIKLNKPLIIHTRSAQKDTLAIMKEHNARDSSGVMHCFTEDWDMAKQCLDLGFYISFSGIISFKNAAQIREVAQKMPLDRVLIETDAPYLAPHPHRGKINQPAWVKYVAQALADVRQISLEEIATATSHNFKELFKIKL
ncbi:DNase [Gammaproteobacteria bacterium]|nr:DNase [Gammaproteobacteria bacterium]